ncbi:hypothetical protein MUP95_04895 [bacterium]|nr:hypothetical protein [bacterium]
MHHGAILILKNMIPLCLDNLIGSVTLKSNIDMFSFFGQFEYRITDDSSAVSILEGRFVEPNIPTPISGALSLVFFRSSW